MFSRARRECGAHYILDARKGIAEKALIFSFISPSVVCFALKKKKKLYTGATQSVKSWCTIYTILSCSQTKLSSLSLGK